MNQVLKELYNERQRRLEEQTHNQSKLQSDLIEEEKIFYDEESLSRFVRYYYSEQNQLLNNLYQLR